MVRATALTLALALATGPAAAQETGRTFADLLADLGAREIYGLEGPARGRAIGNEVLADLPLAEEGIESLKGRNLRTRYWVIEGNGGVVPNHDHANRPAAFIVLTGEILEFRNDTDGSIFHELGGLALEEGRIAHWWLNEGDEDVRLIAFDVHQAAPDIDGVAVAPPPRPGRALPMPTIASGDLFLEGAVDLGAHFDGAFGAGLVLSVYRANIPAGLILPGFTRPGEPLQAFVWQGEVTEHRSDLAQPRVLAAESGSTIAGGATAYWLNTGDTEAVMFFGVVEAADEVDGVPRVGRVGHGD